MPRWDACLPPAWRAAVVQPRGLRVHREHGMPARQAFGEDEAGKTCFFACDYRLVEPCLDDDVGLCTALVLGESLRAWRVWNACWLVSHRRWPDADLGELIETLTQTQRMPRHGIARA